MRRAPHAFDWSHVIVGSVLAAIGAGLIVHGIMLIIASPIHRWPIIMAAFSVIAGLLCLGYGAEMVRSGWRQ
jgi:hypothetical protein